MVFQALGIEVPQSGIEAIIASPVMRRYAKAPEHAYDAALRRDVLAAADWQHAAEIRRGMAWLEGLAGQHALVRDVLNVRGGPHAKPASQA
jgi:hypothetical protein